MPTVCSPPVFSYLKQIQIQKCIQTNTHSLPRSDKDTRTSVFYIILTKNVFKTKTNTKMCFKQILTVPTVCSQPPIPSRGRLSISVIIVTIIIITIIIIKTIVIVIIIIITIQSPLSEQASTSPISLLPFNHHYQNKCHCHHHHHHHKHDNLIIIAVVVIIISIIIFDIIIR